MKRIYSIILLGISLSTALLSSAASADSGWSPILSIQSIVVTNSDLILELGSYASGPAGCQNATTMRINRAEGNYEVISSAILTALAQGKPFTAWQQECLLDGAILFTSVRVTQ